MSRALYGNDRRSMRAICTERERETLCVLCVQQLQALFELPNGLQPNAFLAINVSGAHSH